MSLLQLPLDSKEPAYTVDIDLSGNAYRFYLEWNVRGEFWTIGIYDSSDSMIAKTTLVSDTPLFINFTDSRLPTGLLYCIDTTDSNTDPNYEALGKTHFVMYEEP
jgi:hypothetical protein